MSRRWNSAPLLAGLGLVFLAAQAARADAVKDFYTGKRLTLITSASSGGGYDQYARLLAQHMPKYIPGNPNIVVQNMPGAEGIKAANYLSAIAARDGTVLGGLQRNTGLARFYQPEGTTIQFDVQKFTWLGSMQQEIGFLLVRPASGVTNVEDLKTKQITASSTSRNSPASIYPRLLNELYGAKIRVIEGYGGSQESLLALERGEADSHVSGGSSAAFRARYRPWEKAGTVKVLLQIGMERDREYPNVPTALEVVDNPEAKRIFEIAFVEQVMGRPFMLPPDVPKDRAAALQKAFDDSLKDKDLIAQAEKQGMELDPVTGKRIAELLDIVYSTPPALAERIRRIVK
ncbi:MAG: Bug family tripartite tricarboxylate transporter substrate binding protein [Beijerinckiaceae bacterium]